MRVPVRSGRILGLATTAYRCVGDDASSDGRDLRRARALFLHSLSETEHDRVLRVETSRSGQRLDASAGRPRLRYVAEAVIRHGERRIDAQRLPLRISRLVKLPRMCERVAFGDVRLRGGRRLHRVGRHTRPMRFEAPRRSVALGVFSLVTSGDDRTTRHSPQPGRNRFDAVLSERSFLRSRD